MPEAGAVSHFSAWWKLVPPLQGFSVVTRALDRTTTRNGIAKQSAGLQPWTVALRAAESLEVEIDGVVLPVTVGELGALRRTKSLGAHLLADASGFREPAGSDPSAPGSDPHAKEPRTADVEELGCGPASGCPRRTLASGGCPKGQ